MGFDRGHFFSALAGLIVGVMLVAVLPAAADNGDPIYLGQANTAKATTRISINYGMVIRSFRADVPAAPLDQTRRLFGGKRASGLDRLADHPVQRRDLMEIVEDRYGTGSTVITT